MKLLHSWIAVVVAVAGVHTARADGDPEGCQAALSSNGSFIFVVEEKSAAYMSGASLAIPDRRYEERLAWKLYSNLP